MRAVPLATIPNQSFTLTIDNVRWVVSIKDARGVMCADVSRDGGILLRGVRLPAGEAIIPYLYLQTGNFIFVTLNDEAPDWRQFGVSQMLVYLSAAEITALPTITAGDFAAMAPIEYLTTDNGFYITTDSGELLTND